MANIPNSGKTLPILLTHEASLRSGLRGSSTGIPTTNLCLNPHANPVARSTMPDEDDRLSHHNMAGCKLMSVVLLSQVAAAILLSGGHTVHTTSLQRGPMLLRKTSSEFIRQTFMQLETEGLGVRLDSHLFRKTQPDQVDRMILQDLGVAFGLYCYNYTKPLTKVAAFHLDRIDGNPT